MKKIVVKGLLPLMMGTAIIGSGFSIWIFNDSKVEQTQTISKEITQVAGVGSLEAADAMKIVFDQTSSKRTEIGVTSSAAANGITVQYADGADTTATYTKIGSTPNENGEVDEGDPIYHQFTTTITVTGDLANYITIGYDVASATVTSTSGVWTIKLAENENDFDWTKVNINYATGKEPSKLDEYKTLRTAVNAATITAKYTVEVLSK